MNKIQHTADRRGPVERAGRDRDLGRDRQLSRWLAQYAEQFTKADVATWAAAVDRAVRRCA